MPLLSRFARDAVLAVRALGHQPVPDGESQAGLLARHEHPPSALAVTRLAPATEEVPGARVEVELDVAPGACAFSGATDATRPVLLCQTRGVAPEIFEITVPATGSSRRAFLLRGSAAGPPPAAAGDALIHVGPSGVLRRVDLVR